MGSSKAVQKSRRVLGCVRTFALLYKGGRARSLSEHVELPGAAPASTEHLNYFTLESAHVCHVKPAVLAYPPGGVGEMPWPVDLEFNLISRG